jgi:hypothetical protein
MELLNLSLQLGTKGCQVTHLDLQEYAHFLEKLGHEIGSSI